MELDDGSYSVCPEQVESQSVEGTKRSLLPVSKTTVYTQGQKAICNQNDKVIPVKSFGGVPIERGPYHKTAP